MEEMTVTTSPTDTKVEDMPVRTVVMTAQDIQDGAYRNAFDVFQSIEGLYAPLGEGAKQSFPTMTIRGLGSGYFGRNTPVIFLLNGHNITGTWGAYFSFADLQLIPASVIERVEVVKGPYSSIYGSGALGGVINIVTKQRFDKEISGHFEASVGSESFGNYEGYLGGNYKNFNWIAWGDYYQGDDRKYYRQDWQEVYGELGEGTTDMNKFGGSGQLDLPNGGIIQFLVAHEERDKTLSESRFYGDEHFKTTVYQLKYEGPLTKNLATKVYFNYNESEDWEPGDWGNGVSIPMRLDDPHYIASVGDYGPSKVWGAKALVNWKIGQHVITPGVEWRRQTTEYKTWAGNREILKGWHDGEQDIYSAFLEGQFVWGRFELTPSLRFDYWRTKGDVSGPDSEVVPWDGPGTAAGNSVTVLTGSMSGSTNESSLDPKIRAAYFLNQNVKLRAAAGQTFRAPTALELYNYDYSTVQDYAASGDLDPERVTSFEVGADTEWLNNRLLVSGTVFYSIAKDRIEYAPDPEKQNTKRFQNLDSNAYGLELAFRALLHQGLWFSTAAAFTNSEYDGGSFDGLDVPLIPNYKIYTALDYRYRRFSAHVGADFIGERTILNDPTVEGLAPTTVKDDGYVLVDAALRYDYPINQRLTAFVKLWGKNLLDQDYMVDGFFVYLEPYGGANFAPIAQGRTVYLTVGFDF